MIKKLILSAFVLLMASLVVVAQTDRQIRPSTKTSPASKSTTVEKAPSTDETAETRRSEKRQSDDPGKSGDKSNVEKEKRGKGKAKGHFKDKHKGKAKGKVKGKKKGDSKNNPKSRDYEGPDGNSEPRKGRDSQKTESGNTPAQPNPATTRGRQPGDRPAPGTEIKKERLRG